ncbi:MAG TPA: DoxX family protein [Vicinamibacterales bacterium]|nr:DoxX family protein [Vicinamibacterales bacterium]
MTRTAHHVPTAAVDRGLLLMRIAFGTVFVAHGLQKLLGFGVAGTAGFLETLGIPFPGPNAVALIAVETVGGLALLAGFFTRTTGVLLAFAMLIAVVTVHLPNGYFLPNGVEFALTMLLGSLALTQTGPGRYSVDALGQDRVMTEPYPVRKAA